MKNTQHNLKKQLLLVGFFAALLLIFLSASALAEPAKLESGIPGVGAAGGAGQPLPDLDTYINYLYIFVLSFVGIAGFISLVIWGTVWVGSAVIDKKAMALEKIKSTFTGIAIALTAFIMLYTINPDLIRIKVPTIGSIKYPTIKTTPFGKPLGAACVNSSECASRYCVAKYDASDTVIIAECEANPNASAVGAAPRTVADSGACYDSPQCSYPGSVCKGVGRNMPGKCGEANSVCVGSGFTANLACNQRGGDNACKECPLPASNLLRCVPVNISC